MVFPSTSIRRAGSDRSWQVLSGPGRGAIVRFGQRHGRNDVTGAMLLPRISPSFFVDEAFLDSQGLEVHSIISINSDTMLFIKRFITACFLFVVLLIVCFLLSCAVIGGIVGAKVSREAKATDYQSGYAAGHEAGAEVGKKYGPMILLGSAGISLVGSFALSFSGALPWCRRQQE